MSKPKPTREKRKKIISITGYGLFSFGNMVDTTVMEDNQKLWHPFAIFQTLNEVIKYRKEKWLGKHTNKISDIQVKKVTIWVEK